MAGSAKIAVAACAVADGDHPEAQDLNEKSSMFELRNVT